MQNSIQDYFNLLGVAAVADTGADPTIPFDNEFHLLGLDEAEGDDGIARKAKAQANTRSQRVEKIGQASGKRLDILLRDKINQAGSRFDGQIAKVKEHRDELHRLRDRRLKDFAKYLCDSGKWTRQQGADVLEPIAHRIGIPPDRMNQAVSDALQSAGQWSPGSGGTGTSPQVSQLLADNIAIAGRRVPIWCAILLVGIVLEWIDRWAGLAYGLSFILLAVGKGTFERQVDAGALRRNLLWGAVNASVAGAFGFVGLFAMLAASGGQTPKPAWAGEWNTDWGKMVMSDGSTRVTATYESRTGAGRAELRKDKDKDGQPVLDGKWCRGASCDTATDKGLLRLVMDENGQGFKGWFTYGVDGQINQADSENVIFGRRKPPQ